MSRIFPKEIAFKDLLSPLPASHQHLIEQLDKSLPPEWGIFVEPFLNGDKPPVVILHRTLGIIIFEIFEWYSQEIFVTIRSGISQKGERYTYRRYTLKSEIEQTKTHIADPIDTAMRYKENLVGLYVPEMSQEIRARGEMDVLVRSALFFPNMNAAEIGSKFGENLDNVILLGSDFITFADKSILLEQLNKTSNITLPKDCMINDVLD